MINLLAYDKKSEIRAGRINIILRRYVILTLMGAGVLFLLIVGAFVVLQQTRSTAQARFNDNTRESEKYNTTRDEAQKFRNDLATAKQILDKEVNYSSLLMKIAKNIPKDVVLDSLTLDQSTIGKPIVLSAHARNKAAALELKQSLEKDTEVFSNVHFEGIQFAGQDSQSSYPVAVTINVTINPGVIHAN